MMMGGCIFVTDAYHLCGENAIVCGRLLRRDIRCDTLLAYIYILYIEIE
jgi:hypothetical protein